MKKQWISLLLAGILLLCHVPAHAEGKSYTLSLNQAIEMALTDNPELQLCDIKLTSAEISLKGAREQKKLFKNAVIDVSSGMSMAYVKAGYYVSLYQSQTKLIPLEKEKIKNQIAANVTEKYFNYKLMERLVSTTAESLSLAQENQRFAEEMYHLGMVSLLETKNAGIAVQQCQNTYDSYCRNLALAKENLKIALQLEDGDCTFVLTDDITFSDFESDVTADIQQAMQSRYDVKALTANDALAEEYFQITKRYLTEGTIGYHTAQSDYVQAHHNKTNGMKQLALAIQGYYHTILDTKGELQVAEQTLAVKRQEYEAACLKQKMGMITNMQLTTLLNELSQCEIQTQNAMLAYKMAVIRYQYQITTGL